MKKHIIGRKGELFVMKKIIEKGWTLSIDIEDVDFACEKDGRLIQIEVKTSFNNKFHTHEGNKGYDYVIFTNLKDLYIIPSELIGNSDKLNYKYRKLKNHYELLELSGLKLLSAIQDCGISFGDLDTTTPFFTKRTPKEKKYQKHNQHSSIMEVYEGEWRKTYT